MRLCVAVILALSASPAFGMGQEAVSQVVDTIQTDLRKDWQKRTKAAPRQGFFTNVGLQFAAEHPMGGFSSILRTVSKTSFVLGLRWGPVRVAARAGRTGTGGSDVFDRSFVTASGYSGESLKANETSYSLLFGYDFSLSRTMSIGPLLSFDWDDISEADYRTAWLLRMSTGQRIRIPFVRMM